MSISKQKHNSNIPSHWGKHSRQRLVPHHSNPITRNHTISQVLDVSFCCRLDDAALIQLCQCPRLHTLKLAHCTLVTPDSLQQLVSRCPIRALDISYCHKRLSLCEFPPYVKLEAFRKLQVKEWKFL